MDGKYTFDEFYKNLEDGYQIYFTYVRNRYLLFKTSENCYTQQLIENYSSRIDELETLGLSETEKQQRKQAIIKEIKQTQEAAESEKFREQLGKIEEKYGWEYLEEFDKEHQESLDKEKWLRTRK